MMHYGILFLLTLATLSLASALTFKDYSLLADIKQSAEQTKVTLMQISLRNIIELTDSIINTKAINLQVMPELHAIRQRAVTKLQNERSLNESDIETVLEDLRKIIGTDELDDEAVNARLSQYTNGSYITTFEKTLQQVNREIQIFVYRTNPKIRQLSAAAQQSEQRVISAFNNVAYAGLVRIEKSFSDFLELIEQN
ncbi:uncharacterized protein LOC111598956 [Drosophila hydei]|uniref:Uncharacterized protein LOC111598956 n=1 Tax=Drosophila hydei TaxID=7224 RepID=A0A6J1LT36_DROHY|nr:uncharacterized protein LOC111598956 [Drosophila hydei]